MAKHSVDRPTQGIVLAIPIPKNQDFQVFGQTVTNQMRRALFFRIPSRLELPIVAFSSAAICSCDKYGVFEQLFCPVAIKTGRGALMRDIWEVHTLSMISGLMRARPEMMGLRLGVRTAVEDRCNTAGEFFF